VPSAKIGHALWRIFMGDALADVPLVHVHHFRGCIHIYLGEFSCFRWYKDLLSVYMSWRILMDDTKPFTLNPLSSVNKGRDPCVEAPMYTHTQRIMMHVHKPQCTYTSPNARTQAPMHVHKPQCTYTSPNARTQAPSWWPLAYAYVSLSFDLPFSKSVHCVEGGSS
jgi:hypothetical protein